MKPRRGEIYRLKENGDRKPRPIVIISNNILNGGDGVVAVPFYSRQLAKRKNEQWCAMYSAGEGGLEKDSAAKTDQITLIDKLDIDLAAGPIGEFDRHQMDRLLDALKWSLKIP